MADTIYPGTAGPGDVLSGKIFTAGSNYGSAGSMPNRGGIILTPGAVDQLIAAGYHDGTGKVVGDPNLIAANILSGKSIFGVAGNVTPQHTASGSGVSMITSGGATFYNGGNGTSGNYYISVSGLTFLPKFIACWNSNGPSIVFANGANFGNNNYATPILTSGNGLVAQTYQLAGTASVTATGFTLPCQTSSSGGTYQWIAYG